MFSEISWGEYTLVTTLVLIAYYTAIGLWLYILKLKTPASGVKLTPTTEQGDRETKGTTSQVSFAETSEETFERVEAIMAKLKDIIAEVFYHKQGRKVLLEHLSRTLQKHPEFIDTPFQQGIQKFIIQECNQYGPVNIHSDELKKMWSVEPG